MIAEGEIRSLTRNTIERLAAVYVGKRSNAHRQLLMQICTRVVASVVTFLLFQHIKRIPHIRPVVTVVGFAGVVAEGVRGAS